MYGNYTTDEFTYTSHAHKDERIIVYTPTELNEPKPVIVLFHDKMQEDMDSDNKLGQMELLAIDLVQSGYHVMNVTYSDFNLEQQPEELENILTELSNIQNQFKKDFLNDYNGQTIVVGYGKGASVALMMAEHRENNEDLLVPKLVIAVAPTDSTYPETFDEKTAICLIDGAAFDKDTSTKTCDIFLSPNSSSKMLIIDAFKTTYQDLDTKGSAWKFVKEVIAAQTKSPAPQG